MKTDARTSFNIYRNEIIATGHQICTKDITLSTTNKISTLLFADDRVTLADSEDSLWTNYWHYKTQRKFWNGNITRKIWDDSIFVQDPVGREIVVDNKCLLHVNNFKYLGCEIPHEKGKYVQQKQAKFAQILGTVNNTFKPIMVHKSSRIIVHNVLALPILLHGSGSWI